MPQSAIPFLVFFIGAFSTFIVAIGGVTLWARET